MEEHISIAFDRVAPVLRIVAKLLLRSNDDVEDAIQGAALRVLRDSRNGPPIRSLPALLTTAVRSEAQMILRAQRRRLARVSLGVETDLQVDSDETWPMFGVGADLVEAISAQLPDGARSWLADVLAGASDADIARRDRVTEAAVRQRRSRLVTLVDRMLSEQEIVELLGHRSQRAATSRRRAPELGSGSRTPNPEPRVRNCEGAS
jgi:DNA-directed RNA polymerase specialized sigma24 family protein